MSMNLVKKSLFKFLDEGLVETFVTYNSNYSDIKSFTGCYSQQTLEPSNTTDTQISGTISNVVDATVTGLGTLFTSELNDGDTIKINNSLALIKEVSSDIELELELEFTQAWNVGDLIYIPSGKEFIVIADDQYPLQTDLDLTGWSICVNDEICEIESYDSNKSQILLKENCSETVLAYDYETEEGDEIEISLDKWVYMKRKDTLPMRGSVANLVEYIDRYVLYVKTKDDSEKDKINNILQNINDIICENFFKFIAYDEDMVTELSVVDIFPNSLTSNEIYDNTSDIQSFMVEFNVSYRIKY